MSDQTDTWTKWIDFLDHVACPDLKNLTDCNTFHGNFGKQYSVSAENYEDSYTGYANNLPTGEDAIPIRYVWLMARDAVNMCHILLGAVMDCRKLIAAGALTKEQIFDLWLERAGELTL